MSEVNKGHKRSSKSKLNFISFVLSAEEKDQTISFSNFKIKRELNVTRRENSEKF